MKPSSCPRLCRNIYPIFTYQRHGIASFSPLYLYAKSNQNTTSPRLSTSKLSFLIISDHFCRTPLATCSLLPPLLPLPDPIPLATPVPFLRKQIEFLSGDSAENMYHVAPTQPLLLAQESRQASRLLCMELSMSMLVFCRCGFESGSVSGATISLLQIFRNVLESSGEVYVWLLTDGQPA